MATKIVYLAVGILLAAAGAATAFDLPFGLRDDTSTATIEVAFSPGDQPVRLILGAIKGAQKQILVQAFSFTHRDIAEALIAAQRRGVEVLILADKRQTLKLRSSVIPLLADKGVAVQLDGRHDSAHDKVIVIDAGEAQQAVITGSFNFSFAAHHKNSENLVVIRGNPAVTQAYADNWHRHQKHAQTYRTERIDDATANVFAE